MNAGGDMRFFLICLLGVFISSRVVAIPFPKETGDSVALFGGLDSSLSDNHTGNDHARMSCIIKCSVIGNAYRVDDKKKVYREEHLLTRDNGRDRREVFYRNNQNSVFAYKFVDSEYSTVAPDYWFADFRLDNFQFAAREKDFQNDQGLFTANTSLDSEEFIQEYGDIWQESNSASDKLYDYLNTITDQLRAKSTGSLLDDGIKEGGLIADAGFDAFVRRHWSKLTQESVRFRFVLPSRETALPMVISQIAKERCQRSVFNEMRESHIPKKIESGYECFRIKARNWLISQIVGSIYLVYDNDRRLAIFKGLSNIRDDGNKRLYTYITYQYF